MSISVLLEGGKPTYNGNVVQESMALTTASKQYWAQRQAQAATEMACVQAEISTSSADQDWKRFCARGTAFLDYFRWKALDRSERPLRAYWNNNKRLAKEGVRLFKAEIIVELLLPFSRSPLSFLPSSPKSSEYVIDATEIFDRSHEIQIGKPYISVSYRGDCLFAITPSFGYMEMKSYFIDNPAWGRWSSDHVFPSVFAEVAKGFVSELKAVETNFAPLLELWTQEARVAARSRG